MTLTEIEQKVAQLRPEELAEVREWFRRFDGNYWDEQIEKDASSGRLDAIAREALNEFRRGQNIPL